MSESVTPGSSAHAGSMSRGTARSISSSGRPARSGITIASSSAPRIRCGEEVEATTMSARASSSRQRVERDGLAAEALRQLDRALAPAVGDEHRAHALLVQRARGDLGRLAGADDQHVAAAEVAERLARGVHGDRGDARAPDGDRGLGAHALAGRQGGAEELVGQRPGRLGGERRLVGALDLALDLGLADDHRLEPARHAVEMPRGVAVAQRVDRPRAARSGARPRAAPAGPAPRSRPRRRRRPRGRARCGCRSRGRRPPGSPPRRPARA